MFKNTCSSTRKKISKRSGFRSRLSTKSGRNILKKRRNKGRWKLSTI